MRLSTVNDERATAMPIPAVTMYCSYSPEFREVALDYDGSDVFILWNPLTGDVISNVAHWEF